MNPAQVMKAAHIAVGLNEALDNFKEELRQLMVTHNINATTVATVRRDSPALYQTLEVINNAITTSRNSLSAIITQAVLNDDNRSTHNPLRSGGSTSGI